MALASANLIFRILTFMFLLSPGANEMGIDVLEDGLPEMSLVAYEIEEGVQVDFAHEEQEGAFFTVTMEDESDYTYRYETAEGDSATFSLAPVVQQMSAFYLSNEPVGEIETEDGDVWVMREGASALYLRSEQLGATFVLAEYSGW